MAAENKRFIWILMSIMLILSIPFIAMQFNDQVNWTIRDFIVAGGLLFSTGLIIEFVLRKVKRTDHRILVVLAVLIILLLVWVELAVGIFGSPFAGT